MSESEDPRGKRPKRAAPGSTTLSSPRSPPLARGPPADGDRRGAHLPFEVGLSPPGSSFYADSFRLRTLMRERPRSLVPRPRPGEDPRLPSASPLSARPSPLLRAAPRAPSPAGGTEPSEPRASDPPRRDPRDAPTGEDALPTLRPESPLRSLRAAVQDGETRDRSSASTP